MTVLKVVRILNSLEVLRYNEEPYWRGYNYGKSKRPVKPIRMPRIRIPAQLRGISRTDIREAFDALVAGHSTDGVQKVPPRKPADAATEIVEALETLGRNYINGSLTLFRTIAVENPEQWVVENMTKIQHLGRYWSLDENYIMHHADNEKVLFCIEATVVAVDWPATIVLTVDGVEDEVRLLEGAAVLLRYVEPAHYEFKPNPNQLV